MRAVAVYDDDPVRVLNNLNAVLRQELQGSRIRLCTLIFGKVTLCGNGFDVELASGGHPPPLPLCADGSVDYVDTTGGQAAGITAEPHFVANRFRLYPGDTLVLYTDGLTEASTGVGLARYDDEGALLRFAKSHSPTTALDIVDAVRRVLDGFGSGLEDDTAVLALGVPGVPTPPRGYPVCTHYRYRSCTWRSPILPRRCHRTSTSAFRCSTVSPPT